MEIILWEMQNPGLHVDLNGKKCKGSRPYGPQSEPPDGRTSPGKCAMRSDTRRSLVGPSQGSRLGSGWRAPSRDGPLSREGRRPAPKTAWGPITDRTGGPRRHIAAPSTPRLATDNRAGEWVRGGNCSRCRALPAVHRCPGR